MTLVMITIVTHLDSSLALLWSIHTID